MSFLFDIKLSKIGETENIYISRIIQDKIKNLQIPEYLYVTDLINPARSFFSRKYPDVQMPENLAARMKGGEETHFLARQWFEQLPGFSGSEVIITGSDLGLNVVGRADFMLYDSVVEFKTKTIDRISLENIYNIYSSDLEQLLFYAVMNRNFSSDNYLVFFSNENFYAYKVSIIDRGAIENEMVFRFSLIKRALENGDINDFSRCSYFGYGCPYREANICHCDSLRPDDSSWLNNAAKIEEDHDMESLLSEVYRSGDTFIDLRFYDLIYPRKYYHKIIGDERNSKNSGEIPESYYEKNNIKFLVIDSINKSILNVSGTEKAAMNKVSTLPLYGDDKYIIKNIYDENSIIPYLLKINNSRYPGSIPETYYSEMAITCARRNMNEGLIIVVYPKLQNTVKVHDVTFDLDNIIALCMKNIENIKEAVETRTPEILDMCPEFAIRSCDFKSCSCRNEIIKGRKN
ncbi:hypothetical protein [Ferroplasma sp.]|uniref:hypothetical protein n=1 Tax=Ferroplasma sp. TaxID=2591003 RepID=UPI00307F14BF